MVNLFILCKLSIKQELNLAIEDLPDDAMTVNGWNSVI